MPGKANRGNKKYLNSWKKGTKTSGNHYLSPSAASQKAAEAGVEIKAQAINLVMSRANRTDRQLEGIHNFNPSGKRARNGIHVDEVNAMIRRVKKGGPIFAGGREPKQVVEQGSGKNKVKLWSVKKVVKASKGKIDNKAFRGALKTASEDPELAREYGIVQETKTPGPRNYRRLLVPEESARRIIAEHKQGVPFFKRPEKGYAKAAIMVKTGEYEAESVHLLEIEKESKRQNESNPNARVVTANHLARLIKKGRLIEGLHAAKDPNHPKKLLAIKKPIADMILRNAEAGIENVVPLNHEIPRRVNGGKWWPFSLVEKMSEGKVPAAKINGAHTNGKLMEGAVIIDPDNAKGRLLVNENVAKRWVMDSKRYTEIAYQVPGMRGADLRELGASNIAGTWYVTPEQKELWLKRKQGDPDRKKLQKLKSQQSELRKRQRTLMDTHDGGKVWQDKYHSLGRREVVEEVSEGDWRKEAKKNTRKMAKLAEEINTLEDKLSN